MVIASQMERDLSSFSKLSGRIDTWFCLAEDGTPVVLRWMYSPEIYAMDCERCLTGHWAAWTISQFASGPSCPFPQGLYRPGTNLPKHPQNSLRLRTDGRQDSVRF